MAKRTRSISNEQQEQEYARLMGKDALERQKIERKKRCQYCGGFKPGGHLNLCPHKER